MEITEGPLAKILGIIIALGLFGAAAVVALRYPIAGLAICIGCLIVYLKPDPARRR